MENEPRTGASSRSDSQSALTHVNESGEARMVDVGHKESTKRTATASCRISMSTEAANAIRENAVKKGDVIAIARIAAIQAAKQTSQLIPLCHLILLESVEARCEWLSHTELQWQVDVRSTGPTGVEMEALTAASIAALTVYDMCKAIDRTMIISELKLLEKTGGARGDYRR